jgi:integrase
MYSSFGRLKKQLKIRRQITPHDLRRTTARRVYDNTRDLRIAQAVLGHSNLKSTLWYLQDNLTEVPISALELAKLNPLTERPQ